MQRASSRNLGPTLEPGPEHVLKKYPSQHNLAPSCRAARFCCPLLTRNPSHTRPNWIIVLLTSEFTLNIITIARSGMQPIIIISILLPMTRIMLNHDHKTMCTYTYYLCIRNTTLSFQFSSSYSFYLCFYLFCPNGISVSVLPSMGLSNRIAQKSLSPLKRKFIEDSSSIFVIGTSTSEHFCIILDILDEGRILFNGDRISLG